MQTLERPPIHTTNVTSLFATLGAVCYWLATGLELSTPFLRSQVIKHGPCMQSVSIRVFNLINPHRVREEWVSGGQLFYCLTRESSVNRFFYFCPCRLLLLQRFNLSSLQKSWVNCDKAARGGGVVLTFKPFRKHFIIGITFQFQFYDSNVTIDHKTRLLLLLLCHCRCSSICG